VAAGLQAALPNIGVDVLLGIGGTPEGVITAAAIRCTGGAIQCKPWPRDEAERQKCIDAGLDLSHVYMTDELVGGDDVFFAATGASTGELLKGVNFFANGAYTQSLVMRSRSGTLRWIDSVHNFTQLDKVRYGEI
jgi:fructose-1,6-bisphosphatase II